MELLKFTKVECTENLFGSKQWVMEPKAKCTDVQ